MNTHCPWSGDTISADSLTLYKGQVVGFCNPANFFSGGDKFDKATRLFDDALGATHG
ncbi:glutathione S-transferase [Robiginitomaculum antarcticum]|uniref:glutathione S-transferase n=1 Tax=Robiginitomaculum antarcticum TaxID=437507 RepID=UPI001F43868D|nr:glutathione S-transferase [Robiginitomaculum antarcticum]